MIEKIFIVLYQGNQSRNFLKKIDSLQQDLEQQPDNAALINGLPFISAFRAFSRVVDSCFGVCLKSGYAERIKEFKEEYLSLKISVTPKVFSSVY